MEKCKFNGILFVKCPMEYPFLINTVGIDGKKCCRLFPKTLILKATIIISEPFKLIHNPNNNQSPNIGLNKTIWHKTFDKQPRISQSRHLFTNGPKPSKSRWQSCKFPTYPASVAVAGEDKSRRPHWNE